VLVLSQ
jgi:hypothetical protein